MADTRNDEVGIPAAPWKLTGRGWVVLFRARRDWIVRNAPRFADAESGGGFGSVMIVDYQSSPVGPYRELLAIPGRFAPTREIVDRGVPDRRRATITHISVSSRESVLGGRRNWGLPKQQADIEIRPASSRSDYVEVHIGETVIFRAALHAGGIPFPVITNLLPFPLFQVRAETAYLTDFRGVGVGHVGGIDVLDVADGSFPDIREVGGLRVFRIDSFTVTFPPARVFPLE